MTEHMWKPHHGAASDAGTAPLVTRVCIYWASLREDGATPRRSDVDAQAMGDALPHVFLAELVTPRVARLRLCGHKIEELMGMDMRGMPLSVLFQGEARQEVADALEQVAMGTRVILSLQDAPGFGRPQMRATLALLPLADGGGQNTRIMGVLDRPGGPGRAPNRFALAKPVDLPGPISGPSATPGPILRIITGGKR